MADCDYVILIKSDSCFRTACYRTVSLSKLYNSKHRTSTCTRLKPGVEPSKTTCASEKKNRLSA